VDRKTKITLVILPLAAAIILALATVVAPIVAHLFENPSHPPGQAAGGEKPSGDSANGGGEKKLDQKTDPGKGGQQSATNPLPSAYQPSCSVQVHLTLNQKDKPESDPIPCKNMEPGKRVKAQFVGQWATVPQGPKRWIWVAIHEPGNACSPLPENHCCGRLIDQTGWVNQDFYEYGTVPSNGTSEWVLQVAHCEYDTGKNGDCATVGDSKLIISVVPDGT
jgi:hypothetical protein